MNLWLLALMLLTAPRYEACEIQANHFGYDSTQYIVLGNYECNGNTTIHPVDWCWCKDGQLYRIDGEYVLVNRGRVFVSRCFAETWTVEDPELADRNAFPLGSRKQLCASVVWEIVCGH